MTEPDMNVIDPVPAPEQQPYNPATVMNELGLRLASAQVELVQAKAKAAYAYHQLHDAQNDIGALRTRVEELETELDGLEATTAPVKPGQ